jgi:hypothetical protein
MASIITSTYHSKCNHANGRALEKERKERQGKRETGKEKAKMRGREEQRYRAGRYREKEREREGREGITNTRG